MPTGRNQLSFILAKAMPDLDPGSVARAVIAARTGLNAYTAEDFSWRTIRYYLKNTGIPISFATTILLGIVWAAPSSASPLICSSPTTFLSTPCSR